MILFAAEIATETSFVIYVDMFKDGLQSRIDGFLGDDFPDDYDLAIGSVDCDDFEDGIERVRRGDWEWSQRV